MSAWHLSYDMELLAASCLLFLCKLRWVGERVGIKTGRKERKKERYMLLTYYLLDVPF